MENSNLVNMKTPTYIQESRFKYFIQHKRVYLYCYDIVIVYTRIICPGDRTKVNSAAGARPPYLIGALIFLGMVQLFLDVDNSYT